MLLCAGCIQGRDSFLFAKGSVCAVTKKKARVKIGIISHEAAADHWMETVRRLEERGLREAVADIVRSNFVTMCEACSRTQTKKVVTARHAAWQYLREQGFSYPEIGKLWSVNHTTVLEALR